MNSMDVVKTPIHKEGHLFVAAFVVASVILFAIFPPLGWVGLILSAWCLYFFRDPDRTMPDKAGVLVSPGDGTVSVISKVKLPEELRGENADGSDDYTRISVFLSVFNVHVNRVPDSGKIDKLVYKPGSFLDAADDRASEENERQMFALVTGEGDRIGVAQVAGLVARRIICDLSEGQSVERGDRFGLIRFGSRMDIYVPANYDVTAKVGQTMIGGESIIAERK